MRARPDIRIRYHRDQQVWTWECWRCLKSPAWRGTGHGAARDIKTVVRRAHGHAQRCKVRWSKP